MASALNVAKYFLSMASEDSGDTISNLKLQKLLYYAQGYHLAFFDKPLFGEPIKAWQHGPVVPEIYLHFKEYGNGAIPKQKANLAGLTKKQLKFLEEIYRVIGQYSAWKLRDMTHSEPPWKEAHGIISCNSLKTYFKTLVS